MLDATVANRLVVVALVPVALAKTKLTVSVVEARVVPVKVFAPVKVFESESKVDEAEEPPVVKHAPLILKQPARISTPLAIVVEPVLSTLNSVVVAVAGDEPMANSVVLVEPSLAWREKVANGDDVATPNAPVVGSWKAVEVAGTVPNRKLPMLSWLLAVALGK